MSVKDFIKKSVLESEMFNQALSMDTIFAMVLSLIVALCMGGLIFLTYTMFFSGVIFSRSFAITLVGMAVLTCMVTLAISTNIVISLGMVGALSIVRFRTAIKDPIDLLYLFWSITTGITCGAGMYVLCLIGAVILIVMLMLLTRKQKNSKMYIMIVHFTTDKTSDEIIRIIHKMKFHIKSKTLRAKNVEMAIEIVCNDKNMFFLEKIRGLEGVQDVTMIQYNGEYHG